MPFNVSEEQSLLTSMITERDAQISSLTHQLHATSELLHTTQKELQQKSSSRKAQREDHSATIKKLKEEHSEQRRILAKFEQNVKNGGGLRVHEYAALMRSANSGQQQVESSYVIRLQAQLCRAMHSLGVMESQLALVKENCSSLIKFMKEDLSHMVDDRTRREIELMNGLAKVDNEKRIMAEEMDQKIQEKEELLDQVRDEYEELGLEYDEAEVKKALEVKYLLEQMEKVREDKARLEKELLAALLEREEQINQLRGETEGLGEKLDGLMNEAEKRDEEYRVSRRAPSEGNNNGEMAEAQGDEGDDDDNEADAGNVEEKDSGENGEEGGQEVSQEHEENANISEEGITSQLENTTMDDTSVIDEEKVIEPEEGDGEEVPATTGDSPTTDTDTIDKESASGDNDGGEGTEQAGEECETPGAKEETTDNPSLDEKADDDDFADAVENVEDAAAETSLDSETDNQ